MYEPFVRDNFNEQEENIETQALKKSVFSNIIWSRFLSVTYLMADNLVRLGILVSC